MNANNAAAKLTETEIAAIVTGRLSGRFPCVYPYLLVFAREFTAGSLAGLTHVDSIPFCTEADAADWVTKINAKNARGGIEYKVVEHTVRALAA